MAQLELILDTQCLFEKLCSVAFLRQGFRAVKRNGGAPGRDGISIQEFESRLEEELAHLRKDLEGWSYEPKPVRRVEIPKPGGNGVRLLGMPCIRDSAHLNSTFSAHLSTPPRAVVKKWWKVVDKMQLPQHHNAIGILRKEGLFTRVNIL